ncbi:hypothetical protein OPQ81_002105 [Rhizoctonia solani]|nr:hypothetical protein OPQ81_002105 [Rhizoctonia solani]
MSQTATFEIELDTLPRLEHGTIDSLYTQAPGVLTDNSNGEYSNRGTKNNQVNAMNSGHTLVDPARVNKTIGLRLANIIIEDKVLYLAGACMGIFLWGYLVSCVLNSVLQSVIGTCNVLLMTGALYGGGALLISFAPPFPVVIVGLCLMGFGGGFDEACLTSVVSHFEDSRFMNIVYAFSGLGALVSPFVIGALAKAHASWKVYYWFPFSLTVLFTACHYMLFKHYMAPPDHEEVPEHKNVPARFKLALRMPVTWIGTILIVCSYAIVDVLSNLGLSVILYSEGSAPDTSRYQLSVFWAGPTTGRVFFSFPFIHIREKAGNNLLLALMGGAIGLLWALDNTASNWVAIAVAGFFLGPNTPGILSITSTRVPPSLKEIIVSIIIGSALVGGNPWIITFWSDCRKVRARSTPAPPCHHRSSFYVCVDLLGDAAS